MLPSTLLPPSTLHILKLVFIAIGIVCVLMALNEGNPVMAGVACFFGILSRIAQAEQHYSQEHNSQD